MLAAAWLRHRTRKINVAHSWTISHWSSYIPRKMNSKPRLRIQFWISARIVKPQCLLKRVIRSLVLLTRPSELHGLWCKMRLSRHQSWKRTVPWLTCGILASVISAACFSLILRRGMKPSSKREKEAPSRSSVELTPRWLGHSGLSILTFRRISLRKEMSRLISHLLGHL